MLCVLGAGVVTGARHEPVAVGSRPVAHRRQVLLHSKPAAAAAAAMHVVCVLGRGVAPLGKVLQHCGCTETLWA
jgi:hypothetical protein